MIKTLLIIFGGVTLVALGAVLTICKVASDADDYYEMTVEEECTKTYPDQTKK